MSRAVNDAWSAEHLAIVKRMVAEEKSAGDIGKVIGKSRNAVIGKILRMGGQLGRLSPRATQKSTKRAASAPKLRTKPSLAATAKDWDSPPANPSDIGAPPRRRPDAENKPSVSSLPTIASDHALALIPMTFLEAVNGNRCLYFADAPMDPAGPDMPVCGAHRAEHPKMTRYCPRHQRSQVAA